MDTSNTNYAQTPQVCPTCGTCPTCGSVKQPHFWYPVYSITTHDNNDWHYNEVDNADKGV